MTPTNISEHPADQSARVTIGQQWCEYRGVPLTIASLAQQIECQVSGHVAIPEDLAYCHALKLSAVGKELTSRSRRMWEIYTGYDASTLEALRLESSAAIGDAAIALYGCPFDS
jgi:hypothetical protein